MEAGVLVVIDGAKARAVGVAEVFGGNSHVQQRTLHKRRNLKGHLPQEVSDKLDRRLALILRPRGPWTIRRRFEPGGQVLVVW